MVNISTGDFSLKTMLTFDNNNNNCIKTFLWVIIWSLVLLKLMSGSFVHVHLNNSSILITIKSSIIWTNILHNNPFISFLENKICTLRFVTGQAICGEKYLFLNTSIIAKSITERVYSLPDMTSLITLDKLGRQKGR